MNEGFYRAFEDKHRGSRELILGRLDAYAPLLKILKATDPECQALDLGCGRGEWLELLDSFGINATGVDLDEGMLSACQDRGYNVIRDDAIVFLSSLPSESLFLVSAFHLVEHISFDALSKLVAEVLRVLKPGGILIMETPNPENLRVGTESFYLDPSHVRPIPPRLLSFIPEYLGFERTTVLRLQEPLGLIFQEQITLLDVLNGVSPDYAVLAQKPGASEVSIRFDSIFTAQMGLTLENLTHSFEERFVRYDARFIKIEGEYAQKMAEYANELQSVYSSTSWRITSPLRRCVDFLRRHGVSKQSLNPRLIFRKVIRFLDRVPLLKSFVSLVLRPFPGLRIRLMQIRREAHSNASGSVATRKKAIAYNFADLSRGEEAPVDQIIERINLELGARK